MDSLQTLWHKAQPKETQDIPSAQIKKIVGQKSINEFERFRQLLGWEIVINTPISIAIIYWIATSELNRIPFVLPSFVIIAIVYFLWQCVFYRQMQQHQASDDVLDYLKKGLAILRRYVWHHKIIIGGFLVMGFCLGFLIEQYDAQAVEDSALIYVEDPFWNLVLALGIVAIMLIIIHFYIKHLYQAKINRIQQLLDDLEAKV